ncbi:hypothetical protein [Actinacidiphila guanduensis]|uniref:Uncharacterized protein n=1 Tax=Actinacidiphila guanduensis TaxID=310781 RepID=A0A1G9V8W1_9ACTN|nr:hypothetical protein [Actinacidiphila guanduensis]SDM68581.1 hypothetical protein SAMN05216259_101178 [Actinacidiphila guanduensis]
MISEPEMTGGFDTPGPDVIAGSGDPEDDPGPGRGRAGRRRALAWGAAGAVLASAVWAGALRAYGHYHHGGPDLHGYVLGDSPCAGTTLAPLTTALGATDVSSVSPATARLGHALDQLRCTLAVSAPSRPAGTARYEIFVTVDLHRTTDPRAEFDDQRGLDSDTLTPAAATRPVPGLGDEAYLLTLGAQSEELKVRHGGAVFTLTLTGYNALSTAPGAPAVPRGAATAPADFDGYQDALVRAMRKVMAGQHRS